MHDGHRQAPTLGHNLDRAIGIKLAMCLLVDENDVDRLGHQFNAERATRARPSAPMSWAARISAFVPHSGTRSSATDTSRSPMRSEEHTPEIQALMRISYAVLRLTKKTDRI